jgi:short-subunit dehydrogenase
MIWQQLVSIFGTFFLVSVLISALVYIWERVNFLRRLKNKHFSAGPKSKNLAIITGASSGLGRDYAKILCDQEKYGVDELIIIARRKNRLDELKASLPIPTTVYPMDMSNEEQMTAFEGFLQDKMRQDNLSIKFLVNCAGSGVKGRSLDLGSETENNTAKINCLAQVSMIHIVANLMEAGGNIIQIASVAGLNPIAYLNAYSASKAFIYTYARGLRAELLPKGINVTTVCPYWVKDTEFIKHAKISKEKLILPSTSRHVVKKSLWDARQGFAFSTPGLVATLDRIFCRFIPDEVLIYFTRLFV